MNFIIRTAKLSDITDILNVEENGFIPQIQEDKSTFEQRVKLCPQTFLVFEDEDKKVFGYICGEYLEKKPEAAKDLALGHNPSLQNPDFEYFYISSFSILPAYRGSGNGKHLWNESIKFFEERFTSPKKLLLLVNKVWPGAKHIYEDAGFKEIQCFRNFFPTENPENRSDGILMERLQAEEEKKISPLAGARSR